MATVAVVIGVALEGPEVFHEAKSAFSSIEHKKPKWMVVVGLIGWLLIVVGVTGEFFFAEVVSVADGYIQTFDNIRLASTSAQVSRAIKEEAELRNESARLTIDLTKAKSDLVSKQEDLEREQQKTAKAERDAAEAQWRVNQFFAKRSFGREPDSALLARIRKMPKASAEFWYKRDDGEAYMYAARVVQSLKELGWQVSGPLPTSGAISPMPRQDSPLIGSTVIGNRMPPAKEMFDPYLEQNALGALVNETQYWVDPSLPDNTFKVVIGERESWWMPADEQIPAHKTEIGDDGNR